jgi:hypothetical protein
MTQIKATVRKGQLELEQPLDLPDGTELLIPLPEPNGKSLSPDEIARALDEMDRMQPLQMTDNELAAWEADRRARREQEKLHFFERAERLHRMWE